MFPVEIRVCWLVDNIDIIWVQNMGLWQPSHLETKKYKHFNSAYCYLVLTKQIFCSPKPFIGCEI